MLDGRRKCESRYFPGKFQWRIPADPPPTHGGAVQYKEHERERERYRERERERECVRERERSDG